ncbi:hypothetical protein KDA23_06270 [Candidatus Saccharibacteria bacterium]|nr:hypothetical protein [Candidatus Saccharibacteria bacterium]
MGRSKSTFRQRGDTIVEVLISLLIISSILAGAFVLSRTSSRNVRDSEEHSQALGLLQGQVELLRTAAEVTGGLNGHPATFCMNSDAQPVNNGTCLVNNRYQLAITSDGATPTSTFTFKVTWDRLGGGTSAESFVYRVAVN